ncbi:hypothetical protein HanIR_Chr11g0520161 [Helianthus annuus]|nr:hypothetical protein HanIR_Chr11g0520161 [Helianthus annuus]
MCSRTVHERLQNEKFCSCSFIKEMNMFMNGSRTQIKSTKFNNEKKGKRCINKEEVEFPIL